MNHKVKCRHINYGINKFITIHKDEIDKFNYNKDGYTTIKITKQGFVFNFNTVENKNYYFKTTSLTKEDYDNMY